MRFEQELMKAIDNYKEKNDTKNSITKEVKSLGEDIKTIFADNNLSEFSSENYTATVSITEKVDFNEDYAMELLKECFKDRILKTDINNIIKTKDYIDQDALESEIYNNPKAADVLKKAFTELEPTKTLRINKRKGVK